jgi:hypothetical protein
MLVEPLEPDKARRLIQKILQKGAVSISHHAEAELAKDALSTVDAVNVLRAGVVEPAELERGTWRYKVRTNRIVVVVAFRSGSEMTVVTAWRVKR